jgi:hypothetical protein
MPEWQALLGPKLVVVWNLCPEMMLTEKPWIQRYENVSIVLLDLSQIFIAKLTEIGFGVIINT